MVIDRFSPLGLKEFRMQAKDKAVEHNSNLPRYSIKKYSAADMARLLEVSPVQYHRYESGKSRLTDKALNKIFKYFKEVIPSLKKEDLF